MKSILLNTEQIEKLIENKYLEINEGKIIELHKDNLSLNYNGNIHKICSVNIQFVENEIENKHVVDFLQHLVCEHLNLETTQVIYSIGSGEEFEFKIRFAPNKEWQIVVCTYNRALENLRAINNEYIDININAPSIGIYKRLCQSHYYFRWFEEI